MSAGDLYAAIPGERDLVQCKRCGSAVYGFALDAHDDWHALLEALMTGEPPRA